MHGIRRLDIPQLQEALDRASSKCPSTADAIRREIARREQRAAA